MYNYNNGYMTGGSNNFGMNSNYTSGYGMNNYPTATPYPPTNYGQQPTNLPIIYTNMTQVEDEKAIDNFPVGVGETVCLITKDESIIGFRKGLSDRTVETTKYRKEVPEPVKPVEYVTKEEFTAFVNEIKNKSNYVPKNNTKAGSDK